MPGRVQVIRLRVLNRIFAVTQRIKGMKDRDKQARTAGQAAAEKYKKGWVCTEAILLSLREHDLLDVPDELVKASTALGAGLGFSRNTCAALIAGALALGLKYGRTDRSVSRKKSWSRVDQLVDRFEKEYKTVSCKKITQKFSINVFASPERINKCMDVIAFTTRETTNLLFDSKENFKDPEKEAYFAKRESKHPFNGKEVRS